MVSMDMVKADFIPDPKAGEQGYGHPQRKTEYINRGIDPALHQMAAGYFQVTVEHTPSIYAFLWGYLGFRLGF
jgi:hypothetical protein